jgi:Zn-finger nucleic acid-binding protein
MNDAPYRSSGLGEGEPAVCLFCGWEHDANANQCQKCGVPCAPPYIEDGLNADFPCPRCAELLEPTSFGRATIKPCTKCHGIFLPSKQFSIIVNDYLGGTELPLDLILPPLPPGKEVDRIASVKCIACSKEMDRVNFASRSDAIVDVCTIHGIWVDAGELIPMLHFVKTRAELGEVPLTDAEKQDLIDMEKERDASIERMHYANLASMALERTLRRYKSF